MKYKFVCPLFRITVYLVTGDKKQLKSFHCYEENYFDAETHSVEVERFDKDGNIAYCVSVKKVLFGYTGFDL